MLCLFHWKNFFKFFFGSKKVMLKNVIKFFEGVKIVASLAQIVAVFKDFLVASFLAWFGKTVAFFKFKPLATLEIWGRNKQCKSVRNFNFQSIWKFSSSTLYKIQHLESGLRVIRPTFISKRIEASICSNSMTKDKTKEQTMIW